ncbi:ribokinase [Candidatus Atribacteria bacterium RBG_19FT_COMBO_35_14]|uniref:Ribokinase n=1 Tax=Candidatus Sediminicultor quintus TaxID=1797291 RepID=A0A1F5AEV0_9BACT|nr:MAG: ribokinase [Candidatus Atribacteria bacterium RBG_19FT_COMBO_35_14]
MVLTRTREEILSSPRLSDSRGLFGGVVVIGGSNIDLRGRPAGEVLERHTSNPGKINIGSGGVGRNIAHNLALLNVPVTLLSAVGDDGEGIRILEETGKAGVMMEQMIISGEHPTGIYLAILDERGEMEVAVSDMRILEEITVEYLKSKAYLIKESKIVVMDTNIPEQSIEYVVDLCNKFKVPILVEPVSVEKAKKLRKVLDGRSGKRRGSGKWNIDYITPSEDELESILGAEIGGHQDMDLVRAAEELKRRGVKKVIVTLGKRGIYVSNGEAGDSSEGGQDEPSKFFLAPYISKIVDVTGAGDALVAGLVYGIYKGYPLKVTAKFGLQAAALTISTKEAVRRDLSEGLLKRRMEEEK